MTLCRQTAQQERLKADEGQGPDLNLIRPRYKDLKMASTNCPHKIPQIQVFKAHGIIPRKTGGLNCCQRLLPTKSTKYRHLFQEE